MLFFAACAALKTLDVKLKIKLPASTAMAWLKIVTYVVALLVILLYAKAKSESELKG